MKNDKYLAEVLMRKSGISEWIKIWLLFFIVTLSPVLTGCGGSNSETTFGITGIWSLYNTVDGTPGVQAPAPFSFIQSDTYLSGTTAQGQTFSGVINGVHITFSWIGSDRSVTTYVGTINSNAIMSGTWKNSNGTSGTWSAIIDTTVYTTPVSVIGKWNLLYNYTTSGTLVVQGPILVTFTQEGASISGTGSSGQVIAGTVSNRSILFYWTDNDGVSNLFIGSEALATSGSFSGTWMSTSGLSGTWTATLVP